MNILLYQKPSVVHLVKHRKDRDIWTACGLLYRQPQGVYLTGHTGLDSTVTCKTCLKSRQAKEIRQR